MVISVTKFGGIINDALPIQGIAPAIILCEPKYGHNVGGAQRACVNYGIKQLWYTGNRLKINGNRDKPRLPREERLRDFARVEVINHDKPLLYFTDAVPIVIEFMEQAENLIDFIHPPNAVYIFGPEDGDVPRPYKQLAYRFVKIPTQHCINLAAAVYTVLYDRLLKQFHSTTYNT